MTQTVILGPYYWASSTFPGLAPGQSTAWAFSILEKLPGYEQQKLQALTVTAVPGREIKVQSLGVGETNVVAEPSGQLTVNFTVINKHATNHCYGYKMWFTMIVP